MTDLSAYSEYGTLLCFWSVTNFLSALVSGQVLCTGDGHHRQDICFSLSEGMKVMLKDYVSFIAIKVNINFLALNCCWSCMVDRIDSLFPQNDREYWWEGTFITEHRHQKYTDANRAGNASRTK